MRHRTHDDRVEVGALVEHAEGIVRVVAQAGFAERVEHGVGGMTTQKARLHGHGHVAGKAARLGADANDAFGMLDDRADLDAIVARAMPA